MVEDRRQHTRLIPTSPLFVSLDDCKSGLLLDVCEGGLAVATVLPRNTDEVISLSFDLPEGTGHIQAKAEIAWTRDLGHLTGVRFVELDEASRQQLGEWICARAGQRPAVSEEPVEPVFVTRSTYAQVDSIPQENRDKGAAEERSSMVPLQLAGEPEATQPTILSETGLSGSGKSRHTFELVLAVVLLTWALVYLGFQMGSTGVSRQSKELGTPPKASEASSQALVSSVEASPAPERPASSALTVGDSGVVLQVGAMKLEDNADALAQELQKKNFPAFVFRHGGDRLYRVAIGPYSDAKETLKVKDNLEKQGFQPILRSWVPE
jgi:SPOR domain/PilZ domain